MDDLCLEIGFRRGLGQVQASKFTQKKLCKDIALPKSTAHTHSLKHTAYLHT